MVASLKPEGSEFPADAVIDRDHLARMTLGERDLEREVLTLFQRQAGMLLERMIAEAGSDARTAAAHTLKGSARAIGAWHVASAAEAVEIASDADSASAIQVLRGTIGEADRVIADLLGGP